VTSHEQQQAERRFNGGKVYHRPPNKLEVSTKEDVTFVVVLSFVTGAILGAVVCRALIESGVI